MNRALGSLRAAAWLGVALACGQTHVELPTVAAVAETAPMPSPGDAADDPAIWVHPSDPALSLVIGTDKQSGIAVYDLDGRELQFIAGGKPNNVDLRAGGRLADRRVDLVVAGDKATDRLRGFRIDPDARRLVPLAGEGIRVGIGVSGTCLYASPASGGLYAFVTSKTGQVEQWALRDDGAGGLGGERVRAFDVGSASEGCVADDRYAQLFVAEEEVGIWRYGAKPAAGDARVLVDGTDGPNLAADVEGLAIYATPDGGGFLVASSQGSSSFSLYARQPPHQHVLSFRIAASDASDGVSHTDGLDVVALPLGPRFPQGLLVVQDDVNLGAYQNFKLVAWDAVAALVALSDSAPPPR